MWVGLGQSFGGLGWLKKLDPLTTLRGSSWVMGHARHGSVKAVFTL